MNNYLNNKGMTLPVVIITLMIAMILGFAIIPMLSTGNRTNALDQNAKTSLEYAEAGFNKYLWHLNDSIDFYSTSESQQMQNKDMAFGKGYYRLEVIKPSDVDRFVTIKSTGWTKVEPDKKKTIEVKVRKKQFVHHVYVSDSDGSNIWWTTGDESHGPYHTNETIRIQNKPVFYDTLSYSNKLERGSNYSPDFKVTNPKQPQKIDKLEFPKNNLSLEMWAEKDNMVFEGRTCIYLDGNMVKIRNGNAKESEVQTVSINSIENGVIYVKHKRNKSGDIISTEKFNLNSGNIFVSGELKGILTIAAENDIYITAKDPTNWRNPTGVPNNTGLKYKSTTFSPSNMSKYDTNKKIWTREATGKDMLGLIANRDVMILHYDWPIYEEGENGKTSWQEWDSIGGGNVYCDWDSGYGSGWKYVETDGGKNKKWEWKRNHRGRYKNRVPKPSSYDVAIDDINIQAAVFAITGGFGYEGNDSGNSKGNINLWGNITQKERKAVGLVSGVGYKKRYAHDPRMFYDYPPHILEPTNVGWEIHEWKEARNP